MRLRGLRTAFLLGAACAAAFGDTLVVPGLQRLHRAIWRYLWEVRQVAFRRLSEAASFPARL